jgi:hypothetical protein
MELKWLLFAYANCRKCKYFMEHHTKYDDLAQCKKFEYVVQNKVKYEYAETCRKNKNMCGIEGKEFINHTPIL